MKRSQLSLLNFSKSDSSNLTLNSIVGLCEHHARTCRVHLWFVSLILTIDSATDMLIDPLLKLQIDMTPTIVERLRMALLKSAGNSDAKCTSQFAPAFATAFCRMVSRGFISSFPDIHLIPVLRVD